MDMLAAAEDVSVIWRRSRHKRPEMGDQKWANKNWANKNC